MQSRNRQDGLTLISLIVVLALLGGVALIVAKVLPSFTENRSIESAIKSSVQGATSPVDVRIKFDKNAETGYIDTITGKDLEIEKQPDGTFVASYAYSKKVPLWGPVSLLIDYSGSTRGS
ncbi:MAG: DUF4845 domain-containing protein [Burkholderiaceae bacterium]|jgi:hypothetical protein